MDMRHVIAIVVILIPLLWAHGARAECGSFPTLPVYGDLTHDRIQLVVKTYYSGDWDRVIGDWSRRARRMQAAFNEGRAVSLRGQGMMQGRDLGEYATNLRQAVGIITCLRDEIRMAESLNDLETAAGK